MRWDIPNNVIFRTLVNNTQYPANSFYSNKYIHIKFRLNFNNGFQTWKLFGALHTRRYDEENKIHDCGQHLVIGIRGHDMRQASDGSIVTSPNIGFGDGIHP